MCHPLQEHASKEPHGLLCRCSSSAETRLEPMEVGATAGVLAFEVGDVVLDLPAGKMPLRVSGCLSWRIS